MAKTSIAKIDEANYPALTNGASQMQVIRDNMGGEDITPSDLTTIKVPSGGAVTWEIPSVDGDPEATGQLEGILVHVTSRRAYWADSDADGPPDCNSPDCRVGVGNPGGDCSKCPQAQFGSSVNDDGTPGKGQACSKRKLLFLLREGQLLPDVVSCPPTSLKVLHRWQLQLGVPYYSFVTRLGLVKHEEGPKRKWSTVVPAKGEALSPEAVAQILDYSQTLQALFADVSVGVDSGEQSGEGEEF